MNFCTLFDRNYLYKGLVLYNSLVQHLSSFHLYVVCFDGITYDQLKKMNLPNMILISLTEFEDSELLKVKPTRTVAEYCWTSTPSLPYYIFNHHPDIDDITYIDADIMFFSSPQPIFNELEGKSVLITPHRYTPKYDRSSISGIYCVQFVTFKRDKYGFEVLNWWCEKCLEWCYNRVEDGKFGDQKYLDDWPERFENVHSLSHIGSGVAPWNVQQYRVHKEWNILKVDDTDVIFYHYHGFKLYTNGEIDLCVNGHRLESDVVEYIYKPYIKALKDAEDSVKKVDPDFNYGYTKKYKSLKDYLRMIKNRIEGGYNVIQPA